jgi:hypothetical protein
MHMWKPASVLGMSALSIALAFRSGSARALDYDDLSVTVGLKAWASTWETWRPQNLFFSTGALQVGEPVESSTRFALTPSLSIRYDKFLLSASYLAPETYPLSGALDTNSLSGRRTELDISGGYYLLPGLGLTLGYKDIQQDYGQGAFKWTGPTAGMTGSAPLGSNWALYGSYAFGLLKLKVPADSHDANGNTSFDATYSVGELGIAYGFGVGRFLKSMRFTAGYRAQLLSTRGYALINRPTTPTEHDYTQGPTIGVSGSF